MLRRATEADASAIYRLMLECVDPPWTEDCVRSAVVGKNNDFFVVTAGSEIIAYACAENVIDEGCITSVAVSPAHRGKGYAKALIAEIEKVGGMKSIYLEVEETNAPAIGLYLSCGFEKISERKKYYGDASAYIMRKELI